MKRMRATSLISAKLFGFRGGGGRFGGGGASGRY